MFAFPAPRAPCAALQVGPIPVFVPTSPKAMGLNQGPGFWGIARDAARRKPPGELSALRINPMRAVCAPHFCEENVLNWTFGCSSPLFYSMLALFGCGFWRVCDQQRSGQACPLIATF